MKSAVRGEVEETGDNEPGDPADPADPDTEPALELIEEGGESVGLARSRENCAFPIAKGPDLSA